MLDLRLLLEAEGIEPSRVLVLRHRPTEPRLRKAFLWLAEERPAVFNAYQRTHGPRTEAALLQASHVAAFIGHEAAKAVFVGLYAVEGHAAVTRDDYLEEAEVGVLLGLGMSPWSEDDPRQSALRFDLTKVDELARFAGRLVVDWPRPDRSWYRWADPGRNRFPVHAIHEDSLFTPDIPPWHEIVLGWSELSVLPERWRSRLSQWRGVYFIFDRADGKGYVGSACGADNMLGRWLGYAASGHGGNHHLLKRDPADFVFSILQRVSPDMPAEEIVSTEAGWKSRLHTAYPLGLNAN